MNKEHMDTVCLKSSSNRICNKYSSHCGGCRNSVKAFSKPLRNCVACGKPLFDSQSTDEAVIGKDSYICTTCGIQIEMGFREYNFLALENDFVYIKRRGLKCPTF
jgi:hypothetical protein